jgi:transportin-1
MQHNDWLIKERSILVLGAIGIGAYDYLKPHLNNLLTYLIGELVHQNKLVRAISSWTLSRFFKFLIDDNISENKEELFRSFLSELVKRFLDKENIVQEAACTAFNSLIKYNKEKITPYLFDIFKIISSVLEKYLGNSMLALYDTIIILTENFEDEFKNLELVNEILMCIIKKWYQLIENVKDQAKSKKIINERNFQSTDISNVVFFDLLTSIIRVCGNLIENYLEDFIEGSLQVIEHYSEDKDIVCKSLDLISVLCQVQTERIRRSPHKVKIVETVFRLLEFDSDISTKQYVLALVGDLCKVDTNLLINNINPLIEVLTNHIRVLDSKNGRTDINLISVCNNSCWTLGILAVTFMDKICIYIERIMEELLKIIRAPKLNKALAQNISICIGRLGLACPEKVSYYNEYFIKQFCMSLKSADDSVEKQEAFQ